MTLVISKTLFNLVQHYTALLLKVQQNGLSDHLIKKAHFLPDSYNPI